MRRMLLPRARWLLGLLLFALGTSIGAVPPAPLSSWPAPPPDAIVPDPDQGIEITSPKPGDRLGIVGHLHAACETSDGVEAELYVAGERVANHAEFPLWRLGVGTHKVVANPLMHPEKAKETTFEVVPSAFLKRAGDAIEVAIEADGAFASRVDLQSLRVGCNEIPYHLQLSAARPATSSWI